MAPLKYFNKCWRTAVNQAKTFAITDKTIATIKIMIQT